MSYDIRTFGDPVLKTCAAEITNIDSKLIKLTDEMFEVMYQAPGIGLAAPQIGVRHSRRLKGVEAVLRSQWPDGIALPTEVGVSPAVSPKFPNISIPYGALVPIRLEGLLACGRHISCDRNSHGFMREIPQCWITGQAAGVAAALAVANKVQPRNVDIHQLQQALLAQGVYLRPQSEAAQTLKSVATEASA